MVPPPAFLRHPVVQFAVSGQQLLVVLAARDGVGELAGYLTDGAELVDQVVRGRYDTVAVGQARHWAGQDQGFVTHGEIDTDGAALIHVGVGAVLGAVAVVDA